MIRLKNILILGLMIITVSSAFNSCTDATKNTAKTSGLPLPSTISLEDYEQQLYSFLDNREYERLNWKRDKEIRNTGPFINDVSYGTHPAVKIYYSPEIYEWLKNDRKGEINDGAMIVKVMYAAPAQRYEHMSTEELNELEEDQNSELFEGWTVMVKDSKGSKDGWFWSYYGHSQKIDQLNKYPFDYPLSGFGQYCIRCHSSAKNESTFASLTNIEGEDGNPISYYVDGSWKDDSKQQKYLNRHNKREKGTVKKGKTKIHIPADPSEFLKNYPNVESVSNNQVKRFPPVTFDHVVSQPEGPGQFLTSDQCLSCHDGQLGNFLPNMLIGNSDSAINVSPFGEWRWSMMGLAGRDPIFFAQLESEKAIHYQDNLPNEIQNLCFGCHGVMGQRQFHIDNDFNKDSLFKEEEIYKYGYEKPEGKYGALAREGISCMSCHQIIDDNLSLKEIETGQFKISPPGTVFGPFEKPPTHPMNEALGLIPKNSDYIKSSRLCGSCHTINLPVYNDKGEKVGTHYEQATYLEWLNSSYQNEYLPIDSNAKSCQDCHMPKNYPMNEGDNLSFKIANIQDQDYPESDHLVDRDSMSLEDRSDFARHTLLGINIYGLEMFNQFDTLLGVRKADYMTGLSNGLPNAIENSNRLAKNHSVLLEIPSVTYKSGKLTATVRLTNLTGHRFPTGVGFRRAFIYFALINAKGDTLWASGRTNSAGVVIDKDGKPLPSEFLEKNKDSIQQYEPHYTMINKENQVQIYQELAMNPQGVFTTSFVSIDSIPKDNRLLPDGWKPKGPEGFDSTFVEATSPEGKACSDKLYMSGKGQDEIDYEVPATMEEIKGGKVVAILYYQSIPPFYLKQRFETAHGPNGKRLIYMTSNLQTKDTHIEGWKLATGSAERKLD